MRILLVEDDRNLADLVRSGLEEQDFRVTAAHTFEQGRIQAVLGSFDVIVLDVMLPGGSGFDLCAHLRKRQIVTPILMLTARNSVDDRVSGLESGADDYLAKPFAFRELVARLRALARRKAPPIPTVIRIADLEVSIESQRVARGGRSIDLTAKEFSLLEFLVLNAGQVVNRAAITAHVWDENHDPFTNALEVLVARLRRKIDDDFNPKLLQTLRGSGYRFGA
jgi:two-component system, OmpR family, copper resistance phosphate regulon response regulator CusR